MYPYRVFISYSHEDRATALKIEEQLNSIGLTAICDRGIVPGAFFTDQIKHGIAFAHAFIPLLTESSTSRTWVHQEIGYAVGVGVPVLPVALGEIPAGIIQGVQALTLRPDLSDLPQCLTAKEIERVVRRVQHAAPCECASLPDERTAMIVRYANSVLEFGYAGKVRQLGALTSFCLPDKPISHPIWKQREGSMVRPESYHKLQREERRVIERHARECGCDLIIDPSIQFTDLGKHVKLARIRTLREFLASMPDDKTRVVIRDADIRGNLLLVGDWFLAHSISPRKGKGYLQTVFSRHAPTVLERMEQFDEEFEESLNSFVRDGQPSREKAIEAIDREIAVIEKQA